MRIAYFVDEFPPFFRGGLGTYAMEITRQFVLLGHEVTVFSHNNGNDPTHDRWEDVEVHRPLLTDVTPVFSILNPSDVQEWDIKGQEFYQETILYNFLSASKLVNRLVRGEKRTFEILVAHDWLATIAGIVSQKNLKRPLVIHFHSTEGGRTANGSFTIKRIEKMAAEKADLVVTVSYAMRDELIRLGCSESKIRVIYNGVDPEKYNPNRFTVREIRQFREKIGVGDSPMIFFIGRLTWVKGIDMLMHAMPWILKEVPDAKLVVLGKGEMERKLLDLVGTLDIGNQVILNFSYVGEEERIRYYAACDVAVFPSRYEPFGIVCTEAMSMGKPVVVGGSGTSGLREQVEIAGSYPTGYHINPNDPADIATYTVRLLNDAELRRKMGDNGRKRVLSLFTWRRAAEETIRVYEEAIEKSHGFAEDGLAPL
ncbi:MAG: glycosyltransferase family 4 protein [Methanomicrobiales archaeon]|nr:glycosyltransferase family 4 protein [Methanomicrobiales archaeon]